MHSPYAFRIVTEVFKDSGAYYAYPQLERAAREAGDDPRRIKLLFRLMCEFAPTHLHISDPLNDAELTAIRAADSRTIITHGEAPVSYSHSMPSQMPPCGSVAIISRPDPAALEALTAGRTCGMVFKHRFFTVIVMRPDLPPQTFEI